MTALKIYEVLADTFRQENVETCFALLGDANMNWASAMADRGCQFVYVRHEHCAVAAAMSWSRATREVGVATVTCGPGVTQILTALPAAVRAQIPLVIFAGEPPLKAAWYNQSINHAPFVEACGAHYVSLHHADAMPGKIRDAFVLARTVQCPVVIGVPFDLQNQAWQSTDALPAPSSDLIIQPQPIRPHPDDLSTAVKLVSSAREIVVMAGLGAVLAQAGPACRALAERVDGLLATTLPARGLFHDDRFCLGIAGGFSTETAYEYLSRADLIIAVGTSLSSHNADGGKLFSPCRVLHIDIKPLKFSQGRVASHYQLRADAKLGVEELIDAVVIRQGPSGQWRSEQTAQKINTAPADSAEFDIESGLLDPRDVVSALDSLLPVHWKTVNSSGHCSYFFSNMPRRPVEHFLTIREFGAIGNGVAFAMGVAIAKADRPVVLFDGDGSFQMHMQELETIKRHGMKLLICIMNDGAYGSEIHKLRAEGLSDDGAVFGRTDLASIARGFGLTGERITDLTTLANLLAQFEAGDRTAVWDFQVSDRVVSPVVRRSHGFSH